MLLIDQDGNAIYKSNYWDLVKRRIENHFQNYTL